MNTATEPGGASVQAAASAQVTPSSASATAEYRAPQLTPVFAEVWKNGSKVAVVDINGGVSAMNGLVAPNRGAEGGGGTLLATRRAAEIAGSIGGEIHIAGQQLDARTLAMRARLSMTYGV